MIRSDFRAKVLLLFLFLSAGLAAAGQVLFVVGNTTLGAGDNKIKNLLESKGHVLTIKSGSASATADATGKALVVISSTVTSGDVGIKFRDVAVPVLCWESALFGTNGFTGTTSGTHFGTVADITQMAISTAGHPMAAGLTGSPTIYSTGTNPATWGVVGAAGVKVATLTTDAGKALLFGYETGAAMFGLNAPARRVGYYLGDATANNSNTNGDNLFHAAANWAMGLTAPAITAQPPNRSINVGQTTTFTVTATGGQLSYQWRKNGTNVSGGTGGTTDTYTIPAAVAGDNGAVFTCVITNAAGTVTSAGGTLTVTSGPVAPSITTHPASQTITEFQTATFTVVASGTSPLTYQWERNGDAISGATSASYTTPAAPPSENNSSYRVVVTNSAGSVTSNAAVLTVQYNAKFSLQPANVTVSPGQTATFTVALDANPPASLQWRKNGSNISGATSTSYTTPALTLADNGAVYSLVAVNSMGSVSSNNATLTVAQPVFYADTLKARKLVADTVVANVLVTTPKWKIPDYVFEPGYKVPTLAETEAYVKTFRHLPGIPSAAEIGRRGMDLGEMNVKLLKAVEELTLQVISLQKEMDSRLPESVRARDPAHLERSKRK